MVVLAKTLQNCKAPALQTFALTALYICIGCCFFMLTEEKPCESAEETSAADYDSDTCRERWTFIDSLYFSMVTMSTVGYGDLSPSSLGSRMFTVVYILVGITVIFARLSALLSGTLLALEKGGRWIASRFPGMKSKSIDINGDGTADYIAPQSSLKYWTQGLACSVIVLLLLQFVSAGVFALVQPGLGYWMAFWHCIVTATTVGFGDVALSEQAARLWAFFHILLSVSWLAAFIARAQDLYNERVYELKQRALLEKRLDVHLIEALDKDGSGVDKLEFVIGMLINLGVEICGDPLTWDHVTPFIQKFDILDKDGSNVLTKADLQEIARMEAAEMQCRRSIRPIGHDEKAALNPPSVNPPSMDHVVPFNDEPQKAWLQDGPEPVHRRLVSPPSTKISPGKAAIQKIFEGEAEVVEVNAGD